MIEMSFRRNSKTKTTTAAATRTTEPTTTTATTPTPHHHHHHHQQQQQQKHQHQQQQQKQVCFIFKLMCICEHQHQNTQISTGHCRLNFTFWLRNERGLLYGALIVVDTPTHDTTTPTPRTSSGSSALGAPRQLVRRHQPGQASGRPSRHGPKLSVHAWYFVVVCRFEEIFEFKIDLRIDIFPMPRGPSAACELAQHGRPNTQEVLPPWVFGPPCWARSQAPFGPLGIGNISILRSILNSNTSSNLQTTTKHRAPTESLGPCLLGLPDACPRWCLCTSWRGAPRHYSQKTTPLFVDESEPQK